MGSLLPILNLVSHCHVCEVMDEGTNLIWNKIQNLEAILWSIRLQSVLPFFGRFALDRSVVFGLIFEVGRSLCWWSLSLMTIIESLERTLLSLSPYIKCPIKMCVNVFQRDMFLILLILDF